MRKYKMALCLAVGVFTAAFVFFIESSNEAKLIAIISALIVIMVLNRGNSIYAKATKIIARKNPAELPKAISMMERALDTGCSENNTVIAATLVLQHGNADKAARYLEEMTSRSSKNIRSAAKLSLSMYYWMIRDLDKAIALAEDVRKEKTKSANLYVNLCTYYLAKGDRKSFRRTLSDAFKNDSTSVPLIDLQAVYYMTGSDYEKAGAMIEKLFSQMDPSYPDPYIHYAYIYLHYGHVRDSIRMLKDSLYSSFTNTSLLQSSEIEEMIEGLENPATRLKWVDAINSDRMLALKSNLPKIRKVEVERCTDDILPGYPEMPDFKNDYVLKSEEDESLESEKTDVSTELNADDEAWLKSHSES